MATKKTSAAKAANKPAKALEPQTGWPFPGGEGDKATATMKHMKRPHVTPAGDGQTFDLAAELVRNEDGIGALPGLGVSSMVKGRSYMKIMGPNEHGDVVELLREKFGLQVDVTELRQDVDGPVAAEMLDREDFSDWHPTPPDGEGWKLVAVYFDSKTPDVEDADAWAVFVRPRSMMTTEPVTDGTAEWGTDDHARDFMVGRMIEVAKKRFATLAEPFSKLSEREQTAVLTGLNTDIRKVVTDAVKIIAANARVTFRAQVKDVTFKGADDVKATLSLVNLPETHALADCAGGFVTVVIESVDELLSVPEASLKGEADQKPLFDASTEGTSADTTDTPGDAVEFEDTVEA